MIRSNMSPAQVAAAARKEVGQVRRHALEKHAELVSNCPGAKDRDVLRCSGHFTTAKGLQWIYVIEATQGRVTIYPLLWYPTTKGTRAMQVDAEGPACFYQEHVLDQYLRRYLRHGDLLNALREFHLHNYNKSFHPDTYKGDPDAYVATSIHGYVAGEFDRDRAVVFFRTFYDVMADRKRFGHLRTAIEWQVVWHTARFEHTGRRDTPHIAWGRGYPCTDLAA
ncbi:MAG TPA: hypothetical protein PKN30_17005 [Flavobacteriales bacterium]|nr:hypothetical protein [Flavobacteriales bacterium]